LIVLVNTMAMSSRERTPEYAILKTMGFGNKHIGALIMGESVFISMLGAAAGLALTYPAASIFSSRAGTLLPIFHINFLNLLVLCALISLGIGIVSALLPVLSASRLRIAEALRHLG